MLFPAETREITGSGTPGVVLVAILQDGGQHLAPRNATSGLIPVPIHERGLLLRNGRLHPSGTIGLWTAPEMAPERERFPRVLESVVN